MSPKRMQQNNINAPKQEKPQHRFKPVLNKRGNKTNSFFSHIKRFFSNRYAILIVIIIIAFALILFRTAKLQLFGSSEQMLLESRGQNSELRLSAPRGDIVDCNGIALATSSSVNSMLLVNVGMNNADLNRMLLDLSDIFYEYNIESLSSLRDYFDISQGDRQAHKENGSELVNNFVFKQEWEEIEAFQTNEDTFNLYTEEEANNLRERSNLVKESPQEFFNYLLYDFFAIEPVEEEGNRLYNDYEAFQIMELRYLILENNWLFQTGQAIKIADEVPASLENIINEQNYRFPGVYIAEEYKRTYTSESDIVSHALGYVGSISQEEYERLRDQGYGLNDVIGKSGVEQAADRYLRGVPGTYTVETWQGNSNSSPVAYPGKVGKTAQAGSEVRLTIDMNLQRVARDNLIRKLAEFRGFKRDDRVMRAPSGCVIAMDAKTGAVLANANYPDFRSADFVEQFTDPLAAKRVQELLSDSEKLPLLNRGIGQPYTPGSTFKPVTAIAAFESGVIDKNDTIYTCHGQDEIGDVTWTCLEEPYTGHGDLTLQYGLITSCNIYFYYLGVDTGIDSISAMCDRLGLGERIGLDIAGENPGLRPSRALKQDLYDNPGDQIWFIADTCQTSIGQLYNSYTMLQMARAISGIATNYLPTPHFIKEIVASNGDLLVPEAIERVPLGLDEDGISTIREGMVGLTHWDKGRVAELFRDFPVDVAAKTGTAEYLDENKEIRTNALLVCYAPADDPEIVISSVVEDASYGDQTADIAYRVLCEYFGVEPSHDYMGLYNDELADETDGF